MENKEKNETQNRREFFKEATRKALPIIGAVALMSNPVIASAIENEPLGCETSACKGSCLQTCLNTCSGKCSGTCKGTCQGKCDAACRDRCAKSSSTI